jgi:hypothetical protein
MNHWWLTFAMELLESRARHEDAITCNVVCYKVVSELLNADLALRTGEYRHCRNEGIERVDMPLTRKLRMIAQEGFLQADRRLADETLEFVLTFFKDLWHDFPERPFLKIHHDKNSQMVVSRRDDLLVEEGMNRHLEVLNEHLRSHWQEKCRGVHLVQSAFWDFEDLLLIIDGDESMLPTVEEITKLTTLHHECSAALESRPLVFLFLRLGSIAFPLTPTKPRDLHRGILTPATAPDVFLQLGVTPVYWTSHTDWYLTDWQSNEQWQHSSAHKQSQLSIIAKSVESGRVVYPLSLPALRRESKRIQSLSRGV